eukprot:Plantae.Rhodophyta-Purpureofilum_apyrenoidigerum.ctg17998.p1 GENE.Plantae.Rhodophyta-Purpureofilum_apyrenoidigerum.ctg17998~~Plantae.Rhodophyta-Purpureofilum_apyrenoidigerum.ctg17998.p1  ORF type:complete len:499 (+),score=64.62 Plantae.Rhodophyta-Purpureofilum_apyrenoidigerum.ctg17998:247-1743(+)
MSRSTSPNLPRMIEHEVHLLGMDDESLSDSDTDYFGEAQSGRHTNVKRPSSWPVVASILCVFTVLGGLVAIADHFQTDPASFNRSCLENFDVSKHMGVDSPYPQPTESQPNPSSCNLIHVSYIARSGLKNPSENMIKDLDRLENWLHANLDENSEKYPAWLANWTNEYTEGEAGQLSDVGQQWLKDIGFRAKEVYASPLQVQKGDKVRVRSTQDAKSSASAESFMMGMLGNSWGNITSVENLSKGDDEILKYPDRCHVFTDLNSRISAEKDKQESLRLERVARKISRSLNAPTTMEVENVGAIIDGCQLDLANYGRDDKFCSLISAEDWLALEAVRDESSVYLRANDMYPFLSKPLWQDVLASLTACASKDGECNKMDMRFGTEGTLLPFLLRLNVQPSSVCYSKLSALAPLAGNVAFELYSDCTGQEYGGKKAPSFVVKIRLHERYVDRIAICNNKSYCTIKDLTKFIHNDLSTAKEWDEECESIATSKWGVDLQRQ